jgi:Predicted nucleic acid-binding protein, contains PIN domain
MGLVISDSSTLIHLAAIGRLGLLKRFYRRITIPTAVWREVVEQGGTRAGAMEVEQARQAGWIEVSAPVDIALLALLRRDLDDGESEVIALAVEKQAELVLLDESDARRIADLYGLSKTGIIGLLIRAKQEKHIDSLKAELNRLLNQGGFWVEQRLYNQALNAVGEIKL